MIRIKNWKKYQHYKDRCPPWVKLHRTLLDDKEFHALDPLASKVLVLCWLLASEDKNHRGELPSVSDMAFRLRMTEDSIESSIKKLGHWFELDSSERLADGKDEAMLETEAEEEAETEKESEKTKKKTRIRKDPVPKEVDQIANYYKLEINPKLISKGMKNLKTLQKKTKIPFKELFQRVKNYKKEIDQENIGAGYRFQMSNFFGQAKYYEDYTKAPVPVGEVKPLSVIHLTPRQKEHHHKIELILAEAGLKYSKETLPALVKALDRKLTKCKKKIPSKVSANLQKDYKKAIFNVRTFTVGYAMWINSEVTSWPSWGQDLKIFHPDGKHFARYIELETKLSDRTAKVVKGVMGAT